MTLKTSLIIGGDAKAAVAAADELTRALDRTGAGSQAAAAKANDLDGAQKQAAASARELGAIGARLDGILAAISQNTASTAGGLGSIATATRQVETAVAQAGLAGRELSSTQAAVAQSSNAAAGSLAEAGRASTANAAGMAELAAMGTRLDGVLAAVRESGAATAGALDGTGTAIAQLKAEVAGANQAIASLEASNATLTAGMGQAKAEIGALQTELGQARGAFTQAADAIEAMDGELAELKDAQQKAGSEAEAHAGKIGGLAGKFGIAELGASVLGGVIGAVLGVAITAVTEAVGGFIAELTVAEKGMGELAVATDATARAQAALAGMFDLATGKLMANTEATRINTTAQAANLLISAKAKLASSSNVLDSAGKPTLTRQIAGFAQVTAASVTGNDDMMQAGVDRVTGNVAVGALKEQLRVARNLTDEVKRGQAEQAIITRALGTKFTGSGVSQQDFVQAIVDDVNGRKDYATALKMFDSAKSGKLDASFIQPATDTSGRSGSARGGGGGNGTSLAEFGRDAGARLAGIAEQFDETPAQVKRVDAALRQVDDLLDDIQRKKPPGFEKMLADGAKLKGVIAGGLTQPFDDFVKSQAASFDIGQALLGGDRQRAEALRTIAQLERQMGPLTDAQKQAVLDTVVALDAQGRQLDALHEKQQIYLNGLASIKSVVEDATQAFTHGDLGQFIRSPGKLVQAFQSVQGQVLFEKLFGDAFRKLQDQVTGARTVEDASERMAGAVGQVTTQTGRTTSALGELERASRAAASAVPGRTSAAGAVGGDGIALDAGGHAINTLLGAIGLPLGAAAAIAAGGSKTDPVTGDVVVTAPRGVQSSAELFTRAIGGVGEKVAGLFTNPENAKTIGSNIGKYAGKGLEGAATGALVSGIGKSLGIKLNSTGSQVGGAIGGITGIPGGAIIGSLFGGLVGNLFAGKAKPGGATVSAAGGVAGVSGAVGGDKAGIAAGTGLGGEVASAINQVAQQLGATIGDFSVQIGKYKDDLRVNVNGRPLGGVKGSNAVGFGDDENAAVSYAAAQAIAQGAIQGVSDKVAAALRSSTNIDQALKEALSVQQLELTIGGIGSQIDKAFKDFEATAKERVRIATQYGFDVVAIEKKNAEDRLKLGDQLLKQQVGSLQSLVDEITTGSLFEGSALDKITALNTAIAKAKADLDAGVDGAADTLSALYQQRLSASKEAYGTTSAYAADRNDTLDQARAAIASANAKIVAAQAGKAASDPALATTNAALDENNDQNAQIIAALKSNNALLQERFASGGGGAFDLTSLASY